MCKGVTQDPMSNILKIGIQIDVFLTAKFMFFLLLQNH